MSVFVIILYDLDIHKKTLAYITSQLPVQGTLPVCVHGSTRSVRETIYLLFKAVVERFCMGNFEMLRMSIQFKDYQLTPQDVTAFWQIAIRTGCAQNSGTSFEDVTFTGNLYNILAAMSYMFGYY